MSTTEEPSPGLRERKRLRTLEHLQHVALDLFDEYGYEAITVERIAEVAEVSPSTIYRHFKSKDRLPVYNNLSEKMLTQFIACCEHRAPLDAARESLSGLAQIIDSAEPRFLRRYKYICTEKSVYEAFITEMIATARLMGRELATQNGRPENDVEAQTIATGVIGGLVTALDAWHATGGKESFQTLLHRSYVTIESGLRIPTSANGN